MSIRVMTYNIRVGIQEGVAAIADAVRPEAPQILAIQEVGRFWEMGPAGDTTAELALALELPHYVFVPSLTRPTHRGAYGHALLSAFPIRRALFERLPQDVDEPRTLLETWLDHPAGTLRIVSTHLSHIEDRPLQGAVLVEATRARLDLPTLVMGDLNATADEPFLDELAALTRDADPSGTWTFPAREPNRRIDYILARDGTLGELSIGNNTSASDHLHVAASWEPG